MIQERSGQFTVPPNLKGSSKKAHLDSRTTTANTVFASSGVDA
jgi:hypothetical protein